MQSYLWSALRVFIRPCSVSNFSNDMKLAVNCKLMLLYADDSVLIVSDKDPQVVSEKLGLEMKHYHDWMVDNSLSAMHAGKTELILISSKKKLRKSIPCRSNLKVT